jgi:hypothetical protein
MPVAETVTISRTLPDDAGLVEFEERPTGYRAYHFTPKDGKRVRLPSVTTILGEVTPKVALRPWYGRMAAESTLSLCRAGVLDGVAIGDVYDVLKARKEDPNSRAKDAAGRGTRVHAVMEAYLRDGTVPNPKDCPEEDRGYVRGLAAWLMKADPQPKEIERLVCAPEYGYAGRYDLRADVHNTDAIVDLKTNKRAEIYTEHELQIAGYHVAEVASGGTTPDRLLVVSVGPDGTYAEAWASGGSVTAWLNCLRLYHSLKAMTGPEAVIA